jgi:hypothetical protein
MLHSARSSRSPILFLFVLKRNSSYSVRPEILASLDVYMSWVIVLLSLTLFLSIVIKSNENEMTRNINFDKNGLHSEMKQKTKYFLTFSTLLSIPQLMRSTWIPSLFRCVHLWSDTLEGIFDSIKIIDSIW